MYVRLCVYTCTRSVRACVRSLLAPIDAFTTCPIVLREVATLQHKVPDDAVEGGPKVVELLVRGAPHAHFSCEWRSTGHEHGNSSATAGTNYEYRCTGI